MDAQYFGHIVTLLSSAMWPGVTLFTVLLLRKHLGAAAQAIVERIKQSSELEVGPGGLKLKAVEAEIAAFKSRQATFEASLETATRIPADDDAEKTGSWLAINNNDHSGASDQADADEQGATPPDPDAPAPARRAGWRPLADEYDAGIEIPQYHLRVAKKDRLADQIGAAMVRERADRQTLADEDNEGVRVGLASAINLRPDVGDLRVLAAVAAGAKTKHVKFRTVLALITLATEAWAEELDQDTIERVLADCARGADKPILRLIDRCGSLLRSRFPERTWDLPE